MSLKKIPTLSQPEIDLLLEFIAQDHLAIESLETRNSDSLDFHEVSVWSLKQALLAAFDAGRRADRRMTKPPTNKSGPLTPVAQVAPASTMFM